MLIGNFYKNKLKFNLVGMHNIIYVGNFVLPILLLINYKMYINIFKSDRLTYLTVTKENK